MIKAINFTKYRKFENIQFDFGIINIISGTNGTCKTSLLHLISNAVQKIPQSTTTLKDAKCLQNIYNINKLVNPKIESLTKGDKKHNDPAFGTSGNLFNVKYQNDLEISFRKHNSTVKDKHRYSIKPPYGAKEKKYLPFCPCIYLGLFRLLPFGEFNSLQPEKKITHNLPAEYLEELKGLYENLTGIQITQITTENMFNLKKRANFSSSTSEVDSNTISAGEDNVLIILTALLSLKYYYENIKDSNSANKYETMLLIDEFDATLHPSLQIKLLDIIHSFATQYKIQVFFSTHSLQLLDYAFSKKHNVIYLINNESDIIALETPDLATIELYLKGTSRHMADQSKKIPVFMEDDQARMFFRILLQTLVRKYSNLSGIQNRFHCVNASIGSSQLAAIFNDTIISNQFTGSICILDGDQQNSFNLHNCIITLPGNQSPEELFFNYIEEQYNTSSSFWRLPEVITNNYGKEFYRTTVRSEIKNITDKIAKLQMDNLSTKGIKREENKKIFDKFAPFFQVVVQHWIDNPLNEREVIKFYTNLQKTYCKVAPIHHLSRKDWPAF